MEETRAGGANDYTRLCPRGHWRPAEDAKLRQLVQRYGPQNWNSIAEKLQGRSGIYRTTYHFLINHPPSRFYLR